MDREQDEMREAGAVVETPAPPPPLMWLLLPLGLAVGLLVWAAQSRRPESAGTSTAAGDVSSRSAAPTPAQADRAAARPLTLPQPATGPGAPSRGLPGTAIAAGNAADDGLLPAPTPAQQAVLIPDGVLIAIAPTPPAAPVAARDVPPEAALVEALRAGQLDPAAPADFERWKRRHATTGQARIDRTLDDLTGGTHAYVIRQDFEFPPGLHGAHSALFLLAPGVPFPRGDPGHSMLLDLATGACMGFGCRSLRD